MSMSFHLAGQKLCLYIYIYTLSIIYSTQSVGQINTDFVGICCGESQTHVFGAQMPEWLARVNFKTFFSGWAVKMQPGVL